MVNFTDLFVQLDNLGMLDSVIPFLLIFIVVYATMEKAQILGVGKKNMNMIFALAVGLLVVIPHILGKYPPNRDPVVIFSQLIPNVSIVTIAIVMALILAGVLGFQFVGGSLTGMALIFSVAVVTFFLGQAMGWWNIIIPGLSQETKSLIIAVLIFGAIIFFITRDDNKDGNAMGWLKGANNALSSALHRPGGGH